MQESEKVETIKMVIDDICNIGIVFLFVIYCEFTWSGTLVTHGKKPGPCCLFYVRSLSRSTASLIVTHIHGVVSSR